MTRATGPGAQRRRQMAEQFLTGLSSASSSEATAFVGIEQPSAPSAAAPTMPEAVGDDAGIAAVATAEAAQIGPSTLTADDAAAAESRVAGAAEPPALGAAAADDAGEDDDDETQERNRRRLIAAEFLTGLADDLPAMSAISANAAVPRQQSSTVLAGSAASLLFRQQRLERGDADGDDYNAGRDDTNRRKQSLLIHHTLQRRPSGSGASLDASVVGAAAVAVTTAGDRQSMGGTPPSIHSGLPAVATAADRSRRTSVSTKRPYILHNMDQLQLQLPVEILQAPDCRFFVCTATQVPFALFSVLRYAEDGAQHGGGRRKKISTLNMDKISGGIDHMKRRKGESFAHLLDPSIPGLYNPVDLDDPELKTGKHRTVISLPCYMGSVIQFTRPADLRNELNDQFRQKHPQIDDGITLSKIRNLKTSLLEVVLAEDLELSSLAKCFAYFEKLILKNYVNKSNRKLIAGTCMLLATKINDKKESDYVSLLQTIEKHLYVSPKLIREHEFSVFAALEFSLHIDTLEYMPHLERLITLLDYNNLQEYLLGKPPANRNPVFI